MDLNEIFKEVKWKNTKSQFIYVKYFVFQRGFIYVSYIVYVIF